MEKFEIKANVHLKQDVQGYYHSIYQSMYYHDDNHPILINHLQNDTLEISDANIKKATQTLLENLEEDLPQILKEEKKDLYVCVVPRAKPERFYEPSQLLFKETIRTFVTNKLKSITGGSFSFYNGVDFIERIKETRTTHLRNIKVKYKESTSYEGDLPYKGVSIDTCTFSDEIKGKNILLIDDLYTYTVNIDEDMIQALYDKGAAYVCFYSIGKK